jgi:dienelactone hydrolase
MRRLLLACLVPLTAAAGPIAAAEAKVRTGPAGAAFYAPPSPLPGKAHGAAIWQRSAPAAARLKSTRDNRLLLYRSTGIDGKPNAVSGLVHLPKGKAPKGGWPVITYAHGTTGIADQCAPSVAPDAPITSYADPLLERWLKAGWAVVRTDYEGLGTADVHPYLNGQSEGRSVLDIVRAARALDPRVSAKKVIISGHSQGGHAALFAASLAKRYTPELRVRGTAAYAPASNLDEQAKLIPALKTPGGISGLVAMILRGLDTSRSDLQVPSFLSDRANELYPQTLNLCLAELAAPDSFGGLAPADIFRSDANLDALAQALDTFDPENLRIPTRVRVDQGDADGTVFKNFTDDMVKTLEGRDVKIDYVIHKGTTHGGVVTDAAKASTSWIKQRLGG